MSSDLIQSNKILKEVGYIGLSLILTLNIITLSQLLKFLCTTKLQSYIYYKKLLFYILLYLASLLDIPLYVGFILTGNYMISTYCFHKFVSFSLFLAYSITIYDWSILLHEINEDTLFRFLARGATLGIINIIFFIICLLQVIELITINSIDSFVLSAIYDIGIYAQILASLSITTIFLSAGLKLWYRIKGVAGNDNNNNDSSMTMNISPFKRRSSQMSSNNNTTNSSIEFKNALFNLILVMTTCSVCIFIQILLLILNQAFGYASSPYEYIGSWWFFWTFYSWVPLWGPVLALLYLSRSSAAASSQAYQSVPNDDYSETNSSSLSYSKRISIPSVNRDDLESPLIVEKDEEPAPITSNSPTFLKLPGMESFFNNTTYSPDNSMNSMDHSEMSYRDIKAASASIRRF